MKSVLLRLEAPLQSWGTQGRFGIRDTDAEPSKSGVLGLVGCALGMKRGDDATLAELARLRMAVRVDREGKLVEDYHTAGAGTFRGGDHHVFGTKDPVITYRHYLADASFLVALGSDDEALIARVAAALRDPVWPLFLGRRSCPPSVPVFIEVASAMPEEAVRRHPLPSSQVSARLRLVLESDEGQLRQDVPLSFALYGRKHAQRRVVVAWTDAVAPAEVPS